MTNGSESAILKGHKLSPTAPRYGQTLEHKGRCPSIESLHVDSAHPLHLAVFSSAASAPDLQCILKKEEKKELPPKKAVAKIEPPRFEMVREEDSLLSSEIALNGLTSLHLNERLTSVHDLAVLKRTVVCSPRLQVIAAASDPQRRYGSVTSRLLTRIRTARMTGALARLQPARGCCWRSHQVTRRSAARIHRTVTGAA